MNQGSCVYLRRIDDSDHASLAVSYHTTVVPNGVGVIDGHGKDSFLLMLEPYFWPVKTRISY